MKRSYGWKPDKPDFRDKKYGSIRPLTLTDFLPPKVSLRNKMPPIVDQGDIGSCTGHAISTALMYNRMFTQEKPEFRPSRLFIYYNERMYEKTINEDAGAEIRTGIKTINRDGFCDEKYWPYIENKFKKKPTQKAYSNAKKYKAIEYYRLDNSRIDELKTCLASGFPFVFGFSVFLSMDEAESNKGIIPMPRTNDKMDGGHAVVCSGYDDETKLFEIHNSWGTECGDQGYYYLPYDYMTTTDLSDDFWTIRKIDERDGIN